MANRVFSVLRKSNITLLNMVPKINSYCGSLIAVQEHTRQIYSKTTLGIDNFNRQREIIQKQMDNISEKFKEKMDEYCGDINKNMIFSEDLKNMIHLATTPKDVDVILKMIKKYAQQCKQIRFGNYIFGPVVMRLFYIQNDVDLALQCFNAPELDGFFDQLITYQILLDLLYENKRYQDILDVVEVIKNRQIEGHKYPKNVMVLAMAACYKMNTKESFDHAVRLWKELVSIGHNSMRRTVTFCAGLALKQGAPGVALEILTHCRNQSYTTIRNLRLIAFLELGRFEQILPILKSVLTQDVPTEQKQTFNKDVIEQVKKAAETLEHIEIISEIDKVINILQKQGHILELTLDEHLCQEIQKPATMNVREARQKFADRRSEWRNDNNPRRYIVGKQRPGLHDLV